jgi:hypothetical protein
MIHSEITATEGADRLAIRELVDAAMRIALTGATPRGRSRSSPRTRTSSCTWRGRRLSPRRCSMAARP